MKKKFKAFSAPPFVLKAVMAGQVGESHLLGITISSLQVGLRDWSIGMSRHEIRFFSSPGLKTLASGVRNGRQSYCQGINQNILEKGKKCA